MEVDAESSASDSINATSNLESVISNNDSSSHEDMLANITSATAFAFTQALMLALVLVLLLQFDLMLASKL